MLQSIRQWLSAALQAIKVWVLRRYYRFTSGRSWRGQFAAVAWNDLSIPVTGGAIGARHYPNALGGTKPLIVYFHGGGWVIGDLVSHHPFCQALSEASGCSVIAVDYRRAPEHLFPAAQDDCLAAVRWISQHAGDVGPCDGRLVIAGDSAGGHLAISTCLEIDRAIREIIIGQVLIYPAVDHYSAGYGSYIEKATGQLLTTSLMQWFWNSYLGGRDSEDPGAQRAFPLRSAHLAGLPPTLLVTAENDPLRDEGRAFASTLEREGVPVDYHHFGDAEHGFACSHGATADFHRFMQQLSNWLERTPAPNGGEGI